MEITKDLKGFNLLKILCFSFLLMGFLSGCDKEKDEQKAEQQPVDESIILTEDGIGPINATTSFNMHQMTLAFSKYSVVEEVNYKDGKPFPAIRISEGVKTIMNIIPDAAHKNIYSVIVEDNIVQNNLGHHLGTPYNQIYSYGQTQPCQMGNADMTGKVLCYAPGAPNILYVFNGTRNGGSVDKVPAADILQGWALESIIWRPKA